MLALGRCYFKRVVFFIVREPWLIGWDGAGEGMDRARAAALRIPLDLPSVFQGVTRDRTVFVGRPGPEETNTRFLEAIGKKPGTTAAVLPVAVKGRVVNLIWGDSGARGAGRADLGELMAHMQKIPRAYLRIIRARVAEAEKDGRGRAGPRETQRRRSTHDRESQRDQPPPSPPQEGQARPVGRKRPRPPSRRRPPAGTLPPALVRERGPGDGRSLPGVVRGTARLERPGEQEEDEDESDRHDRGHEQPPGEPPALGRVPRELDAAARLGLPRHLHVERRGRTHRCRRPGCGGPPGRRSTGA